MKALITPAFAMLALAACATDDGGASIPSEMVDLGALVTENLPERVWGKRLLAELGYARPNSFEPIRWRTETDRGAFDGSNAYYTFFNHGGPHVDAPAHYGFSGGLDSYAIEKFSGRLKVVDVSQFPKGRTVPKEVFIEQGIEPQDIVLIYTNYLPPTSDEERPETITLTREAAEYLATLPVRAYGTDAFSVGSPATAEGDADTDTARIAPVHNAFLSRGIPIYEQLFNVGRLLGKEDMYFTGVPLNIENGDGMIVRPVVFVY
jgi:arylformamidase